MKRFGVGSALVLGLGLLGASAASGLLFGAVSIPAAHLAEVLTGGGAAWERTLLLDVRLPRVVAGAFVGAGLSLSGTAMQGLFRNPLADPSVLGVAAGASFGAVLAMYLGLAAATIWAVPTMAVAAGIATSFVVYATSVQRGHTSIGTLLLAGLAVGTLASAMTSFLLSIALEEYEQGRQTFRWLMGGLEARTWQEVALVGPATLIGSAVVLSSSRELDALLLGEVQAASVGVDVARVRKRLIFATSLVVGSAVAVSGVIAFVGLVVPHVLRLLVGPSHGRLLPVSFVYGAAFLVAADTLSRTVLAPNEIRLGVVTAAFGAPFFLFLLLRRGDRSFA